MPRADLLTAGSFALALVNLTVMWLLSRKHPAGWLLGITAQLLWVPYDVATAQYGFVLITCAAVPVYVRGWRDWRCR